MIKDISEMNRIAEKIESELLPEQSGRLQKQIEFILEADKLKHTLRKTILLDRSRRENSAEHSWHIALTVLVLSEYAREKAIDVLRVVEMLLIHDLVEIDAKDTYCYDDQGREDQVQREALAADRIFTILPEDQARSFRKLWDEFEARETPESRLANALDRLQPFLHNYFTKGQTWQENDVKSSQVVARMQPVEDGSSLLWNYVKALLDDAVKKGYLSDVTKK
ncbi:MAG: HD domain-containing protein [Desulfobacterales bacterium]|nr:MAG: HD domain-containing protein [Desulfobacterales bacterium]